MLFQDQCLPSVNALLGKSNKKTFIFTKRQKINISKTIKGETFLVNWLKRALKTISTAFGDKQLICTKKYPLFCLFYVSFVFAILL